MSRDEAADVTLILRPGVRETIEHAQSAGYKLGFVTTTSKAIVDALLAALDPQIDASTFDVIVNDEHVGGVRAARAAGLRCIAFPNANTAGAEFDDATDTADQLDADRVVSLAAA